MGVGVPEVLFPQTKRFRAAVNIINDLEVKRFPLVLTRILKNLDAKGEAVFSDEEREQLQDLLAISGSDLGTLVEACSFVFERSAYHQLQPAEIATHLIKAEVVDEKVQIFQAVWESEAGDVLKRLNARAFGAFPELESIDWRLTVQVSRSSLGRLHEPSALFQLQLQDKENGSSTISPVEFSHSELLSFLQQLDHVQAQLDTLH